jgi:serine/threonine protein kinase
MHTLKHPNLVCQEKVLESTITFNAASAYYFMVLEYCDMGNLLTYQSKLKSKTFSLSEALEILVEVMKGLRLVHEFNYIHRDIKSENVLIKTGENGRQFKIADFGFARPMNTGHANTICGTEKYMAPEILKNQPYNRSVDIWALGILLFFMLFAEYPFKGHDLYADIHRKCHEGFSLRHVIAKHEKVKEVTPDLEDFFRQLFVIDSRKRISFSALATHPLLKAYHHQFEDSRKFYQATEKNGYNMVYPEP